MGTARFVRKVSRFFQDRACTPNRQFPNAAPCGLRPESAFGTPREPSLVAVLRSEVEGAGISHSARRSFGSSSWVHNVRLQPRRLM